MKIEVPSVLALLKAFDFKKIFRDCLGWDGYNAALDIPIGGSIFRVVAVAEKRGFVVYVCPNIPDYGTRLKIDRHVTKSTHEHLIIYADEKAGRQVWQWARREPGRPAAYREHPWYSTRSGEALAIKLEHLATTLEEEEKLTIVGVSKKAGEAFDIEKTTKKFFDRFTQEHEGFMAFITGINAGADREWYTSLMLNRLMFVYFIQKKGFLDGDVDYLKNRLQRLKERAGKDKFHSFYRYFLLRLFHDGLGKAPGQRPEDPAFKELLGNVPYLNGGFFEVHQLEAKYPQLEIPDDAFENVFAFFDSYDWCLDERPTRSGKEINPDVVGYIFEKYINQKQMGAYYTKEDITEYISKNTIIPFLFDAAKKACPIAFKRGSYLWRLLSENPDRYIYSAVRKGVITEDGNIIPERELPDFVQTGMNDPSARMFDKRYNLSQATGGDAVRLPTETWREYVARRTRCLEIRNKLSAGEVHEINNLITLNLDIWQFARDAIAHCEGPELLRAFWNALREITVLDPTCGSGAFLFAALRILQTLYEDCLGRMEGFVAEAAPANHPTAAGRTPRPEKFTDFRPVLDQVAGHPSADYFILKSIINNLYGVDIMPEAVEICKLRLFLKLAAQAETFEQLEPLPDIDFNIRTGNTLVGYATLESLKKGQEGKFLFSAEELADIGRTATGTARIFTQFKRMQTEGSANPELLAPTKAAMRQALAKLADRLDRYLSGEYNIDATQKLAEYEKWKTSHQPFHWFTEFYGIMCQGGFDVIIGNPPYFDLKQGLNYTIKNYATLPTKNLFPLIIERCISLVSGQARLGFIVPISSISTEGYSELQRIVFNLSGYFSSYDDRPSRLFDGLEHIQLTIHLLENARRQRPSHFVTECRRWSTAERPSLFPTLGYEGAETTFLSNCVPKVGSRQAYSILNKVWRNKESLGTQTFPTGEHKVFYSRKVHNFLQALDFTPKVYDGSGKLRAPSELKPLAFAAAHEATAVFCILNSTLFRWFINAFSDCRHVNRREVEGFKCDLRRLLGNQREKISALGMELTESLGRTSEFREMKFKHHRLRVQCIIPKLSKRIIDEIDHVLAEHYGFTPEELDFIVNYDIKYRMGAGDKEDDA